MPNAPKREKRENKLPVKKNYERRYQETDDGDAERNRFGGCDSWWQW